ncbi:MAG TPA: ferritin-like domain-containing protein [Edaphobacter sp.]|nr:ferritin-like domain-containing protein [Edaphobacter sp.]
MPLRGESKMAGRRLRAFVKSRRLSRHLSCLRRKRSNRKPKRKTNMPLVKDLLVEELQDLLHAEGQLVGALPKMAAAANNPKLREAFEKHLVQTQTHVERLKQAFELLGEAAEPKPCRAMIGLVEEGQEVIEEGTDKEELAADLALICAAQKVEHYEISGYGTARALARQIGAIEVATLLSHTLGEEESADHLLTTIAKPLLQEASIEDMALEAASR